MIFVTQNPKDTEKLAGFLLDKIKSLNGKKAAVIALEGELGAGKTVLTRGLAKAVGIGAKIKSPTFTLMKEYKIPSLGKSQITSTKSQTNSKIQNPNFKLLYHLDCYRLRDHRDLKVLGIKEILNDPENIVLIEWSDRVKKILPKKHIKIHIDHIDKCTRKVSIL